MLENQIALNDKLNIFETYYFNHITYNQSNSFIRDKFIFRTINYSGDFQSFEIYV